MKKLKDVMVAYLGIRNSNDFELSKDIQILNANETVPVTIEYIKDKIGVAKNFKKVDNKITADIKVDHTKLDSIFRLAFSYQREEGNDEPEEIEIISVGMLPRSKDA